MAAAPVAAAPADEMAEAKEHFKKGQTHYALGEFDEAVAEFRAAYRLRDEPAILFNIAQAMRQLGQFKQAHFYYAQYLARRPEATNRADVEQFMVQMRRKADAEEEAERLRRAAEGARALSTPSVQAPVAQVSPAQPIDAPVASGREGGAAVPGGSAAGAPGSSSETGTPLSGSTATSAGPSAGPAPLAAAAGADASPGNGASAEGGGAAPLESLRPGPAPAWTTRRVIRYSGFGAIGAGVVAEGLALLFHASAQASADEFSRKYQSGTLQPADAALRDNVNSKGRLSTIAAVGGAVLVVAGVAVVLAF
jgi:hypothetical protein